jgi:hypothetical protein
MAEAMVDRGATFSTEANRASRNPRGPGGQALAGRDEHRSGVMPKSAVETLTAPRIDRVNTFEAPNTVVPKPIGAKIQGAAGERCGPGLSQQGPC